MRKLTVLSAVLICCLFDLPAAWAAVTYTMPGTYTVPANCGFTVLGANSGWIRMSLTNDSETSDLHVMPGETYPLQLATVTIGDVGIEVDTTLACSCPTVLDPVAAPGTCYTRSLGVDYCEEDDSRAKIADADEISPGPDLGLVGVGFYGSGKGDIDYLGWLQGNYGEYWRTARLREGQWNLGAPRRCRFVGDSENTYITVIAP